MRFSAVIFLTAVVSVSLPGFAQDVVPDTLDWHRYFPLEIGNVWEYESIEGPPMSRFEVVADSVYNGRSYFVIRQKILSTYATTFFARLDSAATVAWLQDIEADTVMLPRGYPCQYRSWPNVWPTFIGLHECVDFGAAFGEHDTYYVTGGYDEDIDIGRQQTTVASKKCYYLPPLWTMCYAADLGWIGGGNLESYQLTYARVGGRVFPQPSTVRESVSEARSFGLSQNYPNPFNPTTTISYDLPRAADATLTVYDVLGRQVGELTSGTQPAGTYEVSFDATGLPSGIYFYRLQTADYVETRRMVVVR